MLRDLPDTTALIDHLAEPHKGDGVEYAHVLDLALFDQVYMKLSGLNHFSSDEPLYESARPFTRRVIEVFGPERLVWGSGTPRIVDAHRTVCSQSLVRNVPPGHDAGAGLSPDCRQRQRAQRRPSSDRCAARSRPRFLSSG